MYVVSFLAFSAPAVAAGFAAMRFGLRDTMVVLGVAVAAMAAIAAARPCGPVRSSPSR